jgi:pimeloyl-ACP methyl ester carboxylesterase
MPDVTRMGRRAAILLAIPLLGFALISAEKPQSQRLVWRDCHTTTTLARLQCATILVPLDWAHPHGPKIRLALNRLAALDPTHRIGVLITNPGGPGGSGVDDVARQAADPGPEFDIVHQRFDVIGLDPRGVGHSSPVRCPSPIRDPSVTATPDTETGYEQLVSANREAGLRCAQQTGPLVGHVGTASAARDIDAVRAALGEPRVSLLGRSYGTELFAKYIALFPHRVRSAVLDGALDHTRPTWQSAQDEAVATELELVRFANWCSVDRDCPLSGHNLMAEFDVLVAKADQHHLVVGGVPVDGRLVTKAVYELLCRREWLELARRLSAAFDPVSPNPGALVGNSLGADPEEPAYIAIGCQDFPAEVSGLRDLSDKVHKLTELAPHTWRYSEFWTWSTTCLGWPFPPTNPPGRQYVRNSPPVLVIDCGYDPATPIGWAVALAGQFDRGRLVTVDCDGHMASSHSASAGIQEAEFVTHAA